MATISRDELRDQLRNALTHELYGTVRGHAEAVEEAVRVGRMRAESTVELLRSARYDWTIVPCDAIIRHPPGPRYWKLRLDLTRATLRIAKQRRWDASTNRALPGPRQCTLGDPEEARYGVSPCHAFTYAKTRRGSGWTLRDAVREFRRASTDRFHGPRGGICALLAEEIAEIIILETKNTQHLVLGTPPRLREIHALLSTTRDELIRTHVSWMPSFQRYCRWWQQVFDVALYAIARQQRA